MKLKLPPVVIFFVFALLMYLLAKFLPFGEFDFFGRRYLILILLTLSVAIGLIAIGHFFKAKTTIDPRKPDKSSKLVTKGIFAYTRNPMYLAILLVLLAFGLILGNAFNTLLAVGFMVYMNRFQIAPEESALLQKFGKEYRQYFVRVRRWF